MNVLLVGNYPLDEQESMRRYTALLARELRDRGCQVTVIAPKPVLGRLGGSSAFLSKWLGYLDKFLFFPLRLRRIAKSADVVHICDHSNALYVWTVGHKPHVVTCHDLLAIRSALGHFPQNVVSPTGRLLQRLITSGLKRARCIVCISRATCDDLHAHLRIPAERLRVVPLSLNWPFRAAGEQEREAAFAAMGIPLHRPYFLHVGANHWYKNRFAVLPIFKALRDHEPYRNALLVLAGQPLPSEFHTYLEQHGLAHSTLSLSGCSNEQLQALYSGAEALIFPSLYEGFGWPILEAQACGCVVATVDRPPMNAVAGSGAIFVDPDAAESAAAAIVEGLQQRETLRAAGFRNVAGFTSHAMTDAYLDTYQKLLHVETPALV